MYLYLLFSTLNIGYYIFKYSLFGTTKYIYSYYNTNKKIKNIKKIYELLEEQSKLICNLEFKIKELENPNTNYGYELIEFNKIEFNKN